MTSADVLVIGSGISSLTAALLLSKKGKSVLVLEQYEKPGGYMHCFKRFGRRFDTGAHYVGAMDEGQPFRVLLEYLGLFDPDLFVPLRQDGFDLLHFPESVVSIPQGRENAKRSLMEAFPDDRNAIERYFAEMRNAVSHFSTYEYNDKTDSQALMRTLETPLRKVVDDLAPSPGLRAVIYAYCAQHGVHPNDVPFGFHAVVTDSFLRGAYGLRHGGDALAKSFVQAIERNGGRVLVKNRVVSLHAKGHEIVSVDTEKGEKFEAGVIISGVHPKITFGWLDPPDALTPAFRSRIKSLKETSGIFGVYGVAGPTSGIDPLRNHYFFSSSDPEVILKTGSLESPPPAVFVAAADRLSPATEGFPVNLHAATPLVWFEEALGSPYGKRPETYERKKAAYAEKIFEAVDARMSGFRGSILKFVTSTPVSNFHFNGSPEGSAYGLYHSISNIGARSIGPRTHMNNLYLTGQNTLFPGLLGAAISGLRTAGHVIGIKPILRELRRAMV